MLLLALPLTAAEVKIDLRTVLSGPIYNGVQPKGKGEFQSENNVNRFIVEVNNINLPNGTLVNVFANGAPVGQIRLGEGMAVSGRLGEAAIQRAIEALSVCHDKMRNRAVTRARLIATEACRSAANGAEFRARVQIRPSISWSWPLAITTPPASTIARARCSTMSLNW